MPSPAPLTVVTGDEDLLVARAVDEVATAARAVDPGTTVEDYPPGGFGAEQMLDLRNPPLFGGGRVVVVRGANELPDDMLEQLVSYAQDPTPEVALVVVTGGGRERKQVAALRKAAGSVVAAARLTRPRDRRDFVLAEARRSKVRMTESAAWTLLDAVGGDLRALSGAVEQLAAEAARRRAAIDDNAVLQLFRGRAETSGFAVADAVVGADLATAMPLLRSALEVGTAPVLIVSAVASSLREIVRVNAEASGWRGHRSELAKRLSMPEWKVDKALRTGRSWSQGALAVALRAVAEADLGVKGAAADADYALERMVVQITSARMGEKVRAG